MQQSHKSKSYLIYLGSGLVLVICSYFALRRLRGREIISEETKQAPTKGAEKEGTYYKIRKSP
jgi:flagellar basal body-associated protein FliL